MTDPSAVAQDEQPPPQPPRPAQAPLPASSTAQSQLEADEQYARQLAQHYESVGTYEARSSGQRGYGYEDRGARIRNRQQTGLKPNEMYGDRDHSFIDDDLPEIRENLRKGFQDTQKTVTTWFNNLKKKVEEEFGDGEDEGSRRRQEGQQAFMGRTSRDQTRRSGDYDRYDADPAILSDDFAGMKFNNDGSMFPILESPMHFVILIANSPGPKSTPNES